MGPRPPLRLAAVVLLATVALPTMTAEAIAKPLRHNDSGVWREVPTGSTARLRGLAPVSRRVAWVSGSAGTVLRTTDGGRRWRDVSPPDAAGMELRDVEAFDARHAVVLSIGPGTDSRVYRTSDGGRTWRRTFTNADPAAFYDCLAFWDRRNGIALSDPVDGRFRVLRTDDAGRSWSVVDPAGMPAAQAGEFAFAASGTCVVTAGRSDAWIASGGGATSRVYRSRDRGRTWSVTSTPVRSTPAGGIFSLTVRGRRDLVAVGGDFTAPTVGTDASAFSRDAGRSWTPGGALGGYRSGAAWLPVRHGHGHGQGYGPGQGYGHGQGAGRGSVVAVGPTGTDLSRDGGRTWRTVDTGSLDSVECTRDGACWASGERGRVAVLHR
ncbi:MAG TPA: hypothetical protein VKB14_13100 [Actinomycetales bacterium]|nr:hypothetical protein [Actinomycetales bacterium]